MIKFMKNKLIVLLVLGVIGVFCFGFYQYSNRTSHLQEVSSKNSYFNNPEALYLRKAFETYLNTPNSSTYNGLDNTNKAYYSSPFVVYEENNSLAGGKQLEIIFINNPDKMFTAIVYLLATGEYQLKGFGVNEKIDAQAMKKIETTYRKYLSDPKYYY